MADIYPRTNIFREAYRELLQQLHPEDRRGRNNAQRIAAVFISIAMTGDRKPIKHLREALRGVLFISARELKQAPPTFLSVAYEQLLAERVPGDKRGRTFCELIAAVVVARALDGDQQAKRELRETLSPPRVPFVLELNKTNCLVRAYERLLAQPCPGDRRGRTFGEMIEAATTH
jgi:hypothetical protein